MLAHLENVLEESEEDAKLTADLKSVILEQMEGKYSNDATQRMMCKANLLDPRYQATRAKCHKTRTDNRDGGSSSHMRKSDTQSGTSERRGRGIRCRHHD